jgi:branched-chain amino acid transport system ATP-binding protein
MRTLLKPRGYDPLVRGGASLEVRNVEVVYDGVIAALRGVSLEVRAGEIVALLGANGAGKTSLLRAVSGLIDVHRGEITKGDVAVDGRALRSRDAPTIVRSGVAQVMEGRRIFQELSVEENLRAGAMTVRDRGEVDAARERALELFPVLRERLGATAGYLSGGEQQMLAIGRALMSSPRLLLLDEPSLGLAPQIVNQIAQIVVDINRQGTSVLVVEQNARTALSIASRGYVMETGRIVLEGAADELLADRDVQEAYLGVAGDGRRSFREVKSYRRRKRWAG